MDEKLKKALKDGNMFDWTYNEGYKASNELLCNIIRELIWGVISDFYFNENEYLRLLNLVVERLEEGDE